MKGATFRVQSYSTIAGPGSRHWPFEVVVIATYYMTPDEQRRTLADAGFDRIALVLDRGGMVLYSARAPAAPARHEGEAA